MNRHNATPSDLTLARARQSLKTEGVPAYYEGTDFSYEDLEPILLTEKGEKTIYEAVSPCNRCGSCSAICPSYQATRKENLSPRGRCQLIRMLKEFRLKTPAKALKEALSSCFLCGACENECHASIPMPKIVMELRKTYLRPKPGFMRKLALRLKLKRRIIYGLWLKAGMLMLKLKLPWFAKILGLPALLGVSPSELMAMKFKPRLSFGKERLKRLSNTPKHSLKWVYFSSCETNYILPDIAEDTAELLERHAGEGMLMGNFCCGLASMRYGNDSEAMAFAKKNIIIFEKLQKKHGKFIIVTDCSSCASFLKNYEQLFVKGKKEEEIVKENSETVRVINPDINESTDLMSYACEEENLAGKTGEKDPLTGMESEKTANETESDEPDSLENWRRRAREFAGSVRDIAEVLKISQFQKLENCAEADGRTVCWQDSCSAAYKQQIHDMPYSLIKHFAGRSFRDLPESMACCGGRKHNISVPQELLDYSREKKMKNIASIQACSIIMSDPCCLIKLQSELPAWYPAAKAYHFSSYVNMTEKKHKRFN